MELLGHGIDLTETERLIQPYQHFGKRWLQRILGSNEQSLFKHHPRPLEYLSGRFAAKEATLKALACNFVNLGPCFNQIEVLNRPNGQPYLKISSALSAKLSPQPSFWVLSITHTQRYAMASVLWLKA